jgi:hypothetical protein
MAGERRKPASGSMPVFVKPFSGTRARRSRSTVRPASSSPHLEQRPKGRDLIVASAQSRPYPKGRSALQHTATPTVKIRPFLARPSGKVRLRDECVAIELLCDSSPGGKMRQQTKPFIVEIKQSRKLKPNGEKLSIWGKLDLSVAEEHVASENPVEAPAAIESGDRL